MSYVYPVSSGAKIGRTDQGKDFTGRFSILAIGRAKIISTGAPGWPGGGGVLYQLLDGPHRGRYVYNNEAVSPTVRAGQEVQAGQVIGHVNSSYPGLEIGWARASGEPTSHSEYTEGKETRGGKAFAAFLQSLKSNAGSEELEIPGVTPAANFLAENLPGFGAAANAYNSAVTEPLIGGGKKAANAATSAAGGVAGEVISGIAGDLASHAEAFMLNVVLILGGAYLVYYGAGLMLGARSPGHIPTPKAVPVPV